MYNSLKFDMVFDSVMLESCPYEDPVWAVG